LLLALEKFRTPNETILHLTELQFYKNTFASDVKHDTHTHTHTHHWDTILQLLQSYSQQRRTVKDKASSLRH